MKIHLRRSLLGIFIALMFLQLAACTGQESDEALQSQEEMTAVSVCSSSISANRVFLEYALQNHLFEKHGLDVILYSVDGGSNAARGLLSGDFDLCSIAGSAVANAAVAGADLVVVSGVISRLPYVFVTLPEITKPEQLIGQPLAVSDFGSSSDTALRFALENLQLNPEEDVVILPIGGQSARMAALESGAVAGTVVSVPESSQARGLGFNIMLDLADTGQPYQHTAIATRGEVVNNRRVMLIRFIRAVTESMILMRNDRQGTIEVLADFLLLDLTKDAAFLDEAYDILVLKYYDPYPSVEGLNFLIELAKAGNPAAESITAQDIVDESFIDELESSGFLNNLQP